MKIRKIAAIAFIATFGLTFTSCQEEEVSPANDHVLKTEGDQPKEAGIDDFND
ncbi:hypothetical protein JMN32_05280 [Fulvivirga sp. 29W222]|uniref:Uncharacterized protein n=1 Tax=Fulvivirga marina TaxID=2494733 RepID=A0A937FWK6_9BACT|nr:hypothetical protein [Fulvivirga marina]MBL6445710.1 hypothetical protein [Fulvivirga marina]